MSDKSNTLTSAIDELATNGATKKTSDAAFLASQAKVKDALAAVQAEADQIATDSNQTA